MSGTVAATTAMTHVMSLEEVAWGSMLIAITIVVHGIAMSGILTVCGKVRRRHANSDSFGAGMSVLLLASVLIVLTHLIGVAIWAAFFVARDAFPQTYDAYYFALLQYTTVGSALSLPDRWRLLGGMIAIAGTLSFAWSTATLLALAQNFQGNRVQRNTPDSTTDS